MRNKFFMLVLGALLTMMPCTLRAEGVVIQLMEVIEMGFISGDDPQDDAEHMGDTPPRPNSFHATINGHSLSITKQDENIPYAQATVVNASTGGVVVNQQFTNSFQEQISNTGAYVLHIETAGGALVGQFIVQ